jgi:anthranilate phosphoribosyltransferase
MIKNMLDKLVTGTGLNLEEANQLMSEIMKGNVNHSLLAGLLIALKVKGESAEEVAGFAMAMRESGIKLNYPDDNVIDVCGTGGDNSGTFNISTATAFVVAGAGVKVAKHGNKSISSNCGSADVLSELGVDINLTAERSIEALDKIGITFLFAPQYHPAMKYAAQVRKELGTKTIFNLLGPLTNPAGVKKQIIGTYNNNASELYSQAAQYLDFEKACFLCAGNKYDEIILDQKTKMIEYNSDGLSETEISAATFSYPEVSVNEIQGGDAKDNAQIILELFRNKKQNGIFHTVCANAAAALYTAGVSDKFLDCKNAAEKSILDGAAYDKLNRLINF